MACWRPPPPTGLVTNVSILNITWKKRFEGSTTVATTATGRKRKVLGRTRMMEQHQSLKGIKDESCCVGLWMRKMFTVCGCCFCYLSSKVHNSTKETSLEICHATILRLQSIYMTCIWVEDEVYFKQLEKSTSSMSSNVWQQCLLLFLILKMFKWQTCDFYNLSFSQFNFSGRAWMWVKWTFEQQGNCLGSWIIGTFALVCTVLSSHRP